MYLSCISCASSGVVSENVYDPGVGGVGVGGDVFWQQSSSSSSSLFFDTVEENGHIINDLLKYLTG
eukprot:CAMPEP_0206129376 /NCGR_PEP_ID=MMETSP1472-20131121/36027_1 /ASSEMBLY_ACC=CAM_ASM_001108 /TAXON_ID=41880 /ORGANISM="Pycnococcus provasolii, Strain RCC251" /LENGTH=65 /DNA_ID=CAMNT_0053520629 /DNA_START=229 /DNA_END=426 /DNA_ORIENTATION=-